MFTWESAFFNATVSATAVAATGTYLNIEPFWILFGVSIAGSLASVGFRWMGGHLKDWKQRFMAFVSGVLMAVTATPYLASKGLDGLDAAIFVLFISLIGARVVKFLATDFDVGAFLSALASKISKNKHH